LFVRRAVVSEGGHIVDRRRGIRDYEGLDARTSTSVEQYLLDVAEQYIRQLVCLCGFLDDDLGSHPSLRSTSNDMDQLLEPLACESSSIC
jgi:hypothetical protein